MKKIILILFCLFLFTASDVNAANSENIVTVVNPVRIAPYTNGPGETVASEYSVVEKYNLPATWLLTYDAMKDAGIINSIDSFNDEQEIGLFLEVTKALAEEADVEYDDELAWHYPSNVFLSGYTQEERLKLIDTLFESFNDEFGYYPKSVGSWWTDAYSLQYMQDRYGVVSNLTVADQYKTDNYQLWGQYWGAPFIPSKNHAGIPANSKENSIGVVMLQWAPREPLNGYYDSLFSTQDYHVAGVARKVDYFEDLLDSYFDDDNEINQVVVGLEGDLSPEAYPDNEYEKQLAYVARLREGKGVVSLSMSRFSEIYLDRYDFSPDHIIESKDLMGGEKIAFWYQNLKYRVGLQYDPDTQSLKINDLRAYHQDIVEPYFKMPNRNLMLSVYLPSVLDEVNNNEDIIEVSVGKFNQLNRSDDSVTMSFEEGNIIFRESSFSIPKLSIVPSGVETYFDVDRSGGEVDFFPKEEWLIDSDEYTYKDITREATYQLRRKRVKAYIAISIMISTVIIAGVYAKTRNKKITLLLALAIVGLYFLYYQDWFEKNSMNYSVHQEEIVGLNYLANLPKGKVLVYENECLGCEWYTENLPAVFSNKRAYVKKFSEKPIVYSSKVFEAENQATAKEEFDKTGAEYIYLASYGSYREKTPFSPGDLGIERVFKNEYSEVWRVNDD